MTARDQLPDDIDALKAMIIASDERNTRKEVRIERLEKLLTDFNRALFGAKSKKAHPDQYHLALEDIETAMDPPGTGTWKRSARAQRWGICAPVDKKFLI